MVIAIDIGNTNIHLGWYDKEILKRMITIPNKGRLNRGILKKIFFKDEIEGVAIASVVPEVCKNFTDYFKKNLPFAPLIISAKLKSPVRFYYHNLDDLGADRVANIIGGFSLCKRSLIVFSFGTAITADVVSKDGKYLGGIIFPGIETSLWSLKNRTSLLKNVSFKKPKNLLGKSTARCVQSGIFNGTKLMVQGFIREIEKKMRIRFYCLCTGGWGRFMKDHIPEIDLYKPDLTLKGIIKLYYLNVP